MILIVLPQLFLQENNIKIKQIMRWRIRSRAVLNVLLKLELEVHTKSNNYCMCLVIQSLAHCLDGKTIKIIVRFMGWVSVYIPYNQVLIRHVSVR